MLTIVGGTYFELCHEPSNKELYGSGLRAAAALSNKGFEINFVSCIGQRDVKLADYYCKTFDISQSFKIIPKTITFEYYHPLSKPIYYPETLDVHNLPEVIADNILFYGMIEATSKIKASYAVYDPQNWHRFKDTGSEADHLALVLNKNESLLLSQLPNETDLQVVGKTLFTSEKAEVVIIKNGSKGALLVDSYEIYEIPVFETESVWPIGSGDIFTAIFAWKWMIEKRSPAEAALYASKCTAQYCETKVLPLNLIKEDYKAISPKKKQNQVYLAGPFFTLAERWFINHLRDLLIEFGNTVFSPYHDVGFEEPNIIADKDLKGLKDSDVILAVLYGSDPGTLFEIGYAKAIGKEVIILSENISENDLIMMIGTQCKITQDLSTAVYKASW